MRAISAAGSSISGCIAPNGTTPSRGIDAAQSLMPGTWLALVATGCTTETDTPLRSMLPRSPATVPS